MYQFFLILKPNTSVMKNTKSVEDYIEKHPERKDSLTRLRSILLDTPLKETVKWGMPTYTYKGKNMVGIGAFKDWSCLWFHQGSLLSDPKNVLINAQEGKTRAMRQWRFADASEIQAKSITPYLLEAMELQDAGKKVNFPKPKPVKEIKFEVPKLMLDYFANNPDTQEQFEKLTIRQQRDYAVYITEPKRTSTRTSRWEKIIPLINAGKPLAALWTKS